MREEGAHAFLSVYNGGRPLSVNTHVNMLCGRDYKLHDNIMKREIEMWGFLQSNCVFLYLFKNLLDKYSFLFVYS